MVSLKLFLPRFCSLMHVLHTKKPDLSFDKSGFFNICCKKIKVWNFHQKKHIKGRAQTVGFFADFFAKNCEIMFANLIFCVIMNKHGLKSTSYITYVCNLFMGGFLYEEKNQQASI